VGGYAKRDILVQWIAEETAKHTPYSTTEFWGAGFWGMEWIGNVSFPNNGYEHDGRVRSIGSTLRNDASKAVANDWRC